MEVNAVLRVIMQNLMCSINDFQHWRLGYFSQMEWSTDSTLNDAHNSEEQTMILF
jgi:hypothetical protein